MGEPSPMEAELIERARHGDAEAFGQLVRATLDKAWALAWHLTGNRAEAEDLVQLTYAKAFKAVRKFRGESRFSTWLYRIELNCFRDETDRTRRMRQVPLDDDRHGLTPQSPPLTATERALVDSENRDRLELFKDYAAAAAAGPGASPGAVARAFAAMRREAVRSGELYQDSRGAWRREK